MTVEDTIHIEAPPEVVWAVTEDLERWPEWTPTVASVFRLDEGPFGLGSTVRIRQPGQPASTWTVTEFVRGARFAWETRRPGLRMKAWHDAEADGTGTVNRLRLEAKGVLVALLRPGDPGPSGAEAVIQEHRAALGPVSRGERRVLGIFVLVAAGWLLRPFVLQPLFPAITDTVVALVGAVLLFVVPVDAANRVFVLDWTDATRIPWGVLLLLGAGFALANGFQSSGLDTAIAESLAGFGSVSLVVFLLVIATVVVFLTEVTSNTATAAVFMPIAISLGVSTGAPPLTLMATAALSASFAFMLPVATPPNAVVFGSGYVTIPEMARVGFWLNLLGIIALVSITYLWLPTALGVAG